MIMEGGKDILCFSTTDWEAQQGSRQEIMKRLAARGNRVLFVEPPRTLRNYRAFAFRKGRLLDAFTDRFRQEAENIWVFSPGIIFPGGIAPVTNFLGYRMILLAKVKRRMAKLGFSKPILWIYPVSCESLIGRFEESLRIYHCIDEFTEMTSPLASGNMIWNRESRLIRKVDAVFASSRAIFERRRELNPNTHYIPSAVDTEVFRSGGWETPPADLPGGAWDGIVGMVGMIDERIDVALLSEVVARNPRRLFAFVGPVIPAGQSLLLALEGKPNVLFLGMKPKPELPRYIDRFDVCIIPYRLDRFTSGISPLKLFEYMAMGKPVVATALPEVEQLGGLVHLARGSAEFDGMIKLALAEAGTAAEARREFAQRNSWDKRVEYIDSALEMARG